MYANSPRHDTDLLLSHTGHQICRIKSSFALFCALVWHLAHFWFKIWIFLFVVQFLGHFCTYFSHWQRLFQHQNDDCIFFHWIEWITPATHQCFKLNVWQPKHIKWLPLTKNIGVQKKMHLLQCFMDILNGCLTITIEFGNSHNMECCHWHYSRQMVLVLHPPHSGGRASVPYLTNAAEQAMYGFWATLSLISLWPICPWTAHSCPCGSTSLLLLVTALVLTVKNNFQTISEWARFSRGDRRKMQKKTCNIDPKIPLKILFHYPPTLPFI